MRDPNTGLTSLAHWFDGHSFVSNLPIADPIESALAGFYIERLDHADRAGAVERALATHRGYGSGLALSGHADTVPDIQCMAA